MATRVIYNDATGGWLSCTSSTYETARAMTPAPSGNTATTVLEVGQSFVTPSTTCWEGFVSLDLTGIQGSISSVVAAFNTAFISASPTDTYELRVYNWGPTLATTDRVAGASISATATPLIAHVAASSLTVGTTTNFTDDALAANVTVGAFNYFLLSSQDMMNDVAPSAGNQANGNYLKLTFTDSSTQNSQSFTAAGNGTFNPSVTGGHDIELWGGGARPNVASTSAQAGGGAGDYSLRQNFNLATLAAVSLQVGTGATTTNTAGGDSWFNSSSTPIARGGVLSTITSPSTSQGTLIFHGGLGAAAQAGGGSRGGSGGGGAPTAAGAGKVGTAGSGSSGGAGGNDGDNTATNKGGNGGASGANGNAGSGIASGGGGPGNGTGLASGNGKDGKVIVYWFVYPSSKSPPPYSAPRRFWKKRAA